MELLPSPTALSTSPTHSPLVSTTPFSVPVSLVWYMFIRFALLHLFHRWLTSRSIRLPLSDLFHFKVYPCTANSKTPYFLAAEQYSVVHIPHLVQWYHPCYICSCAHPKPRRPPDCSSPGSSIRGIFQARILAWVAISYSRESSWPRDQTCISCISYMGRRVLTPSATWEVPTTTHYCIK